MKKEIERATIEDVARLAGVSHATVGRVVGNYGSVSDKTRKRVMEAIESLNYKPNAVAQSLRSNKTNTLGVIVSSIANNFFSKVISSIENEAMKSGYSVMVCSTHENAQEELKLVRVMQNRRVDGIIMSSLGDNKLAAELQSYSMPIVFIDQSIPNFPFDQIDSTHYQGTFEATEYLIGLGHKKIGVLATSKFPSVRQRLQGYQDALHKHGIPYDHTLIADSHEWDWNLGQRMLRDLLVINHDITAILVLNNNLCDSVVLGMRELNKKIYEDISLLTWDDTPLNEILGISAIVQFPEIIGRLAVSQALKRVEESSSGSLEKEETYYKKLDTQLVIRESCRKIT